MSLTDTQNPKRLRTPNDSPLKVLFLAPLAIWLTLLFLLPLFFLLWIGFWRVENFQAIPDVSFANYAEIFSSFFSRSRYGLALAQSLWVAVTTACFAVILSYLVALSIAFAVPMRWQRLALLLAIAPFWSSYVLRLYAWQTILSRNGVINSVLKQVGLSDYRIEIIYTQIATRIGLIHYLAPILIVILYVSILAIDRVLIEAARELGATRWQAFTRVILPLSRFGLMTAASFAVIVGLGDALSGNLLGGGTGASIIGKLPTYASMIMSDYSSSTNLPRTSALATILIAVMVLALGIGIFMAERARRRVS
ncbi:ABC transporter permease [Agrobacterium sp. NPDC090273]|uniref:ABC transporter permease n=1 Tax=Agrobacterium sp. NPDC090273 TaxID=3363919 RepID=UPI00383BB46D